MYNKLRDAAKSSDVVITTGGVSMGELVKLFHNLSSLFEGPPEGGQGQISPGPQAPRGLITPNALRSGGPHKVNQQ